MPNKASKNARPHFKQPKFGKINTAKDLGELIRTFRKNQKITLEKVSALTYLGMRFISEVERGKETAEIGKVLDLIDRLGLEVIIQPRGYPYKLKNSPQSMDEIDD